MVQNGDFGENLLHSATYCTILLHKAPSNYIMSSTIRIKKTCQFCGKIFIAKTTVTKYCGDDCSKKGYKKRKREEKVLKAEIQEIERTFDSNLGAKLFLNIKEITELLGVSRWTIYRMIKRGELKSKKFGRRVVIARKDIDNMFSED